MTGFVLRRSLSRETQYDAVMVALAAAGGAVLAMGPPAPVIAAGVWWTSNTIAHNFIHRPFFRGRAANRLFALYLTAITGIPQALWRDRHLAHHAGLRPRVRLSWDLGVQIAVVAALWTALAAAAPAFFTVSYLPGYAGGLLLCALHGFYEHHGGTTSHYGRVYNLLLFNDGYHVEHHARPGVHCSRLPGHRRPRARESRWPAPLRWLEERHGSHGTHGPGILGLTALERVVLASPLLQRFVVRTHARALRAILSALAEPPRRVAIV